MFREILFDLIVNESKMTKEDYLKKAEYIEKHALLVKCK